VAGGGFLPFPLTTAHGQQAARPSPAKPQALPRAVQDLASGGPVLRFFAQTLSSSLNPSAACVRPVFRQGLRLEKYNVHWADTTEIFDFCGKQKQVRLEYLGAGASRTFALRVVDPARA